MPKFNVSVLINAIDKATAPMKAIGQQATAMGQKFLLAGAVITGVLGASVKKFADFEKQMAEVGIKSQATVEQLKDMSKLAREMGAVTAFSASEAAGGMRFLALAGLDVNQIMAALPGTLDIAAANAIDLATAADIVTNVMSQFKLEAKDTGRIGDILTMVANSSNTEFTEMAQALSFVGSKAASMNVSLEDTATLIGVLGSAGLKSTRAGTALNMALTNITDPKKQKALQALGVKVFDKNGNLNNAIDIFEKIDKALSKLTIEKRVGVLSDIFDERGLKAFNAFSNIGFDAIRILQEKATSGSQGAASEAAAKQLATIAGAFIILASALEEVALTFGETLSPAVVKIANGIKFLADKFNALPKPAKDFIVVMTAIAGIGLVIGGALLITLGSILGLITGIVGFFTTVALGPEILAIGAIIAGVTAQLVAMFGMLAFAFIKLQADIKQAGEFWKKYGNLIKTLFPPIRWIINAGATLKEVWEAVLSGLAQAWNKVAKAIQPVVDKIKFLIKGFQIAINLAADLANKNPIKDINLITGQEISATSNGFIKQASEGAIGERKGKKDDLSISLKIDSPTGVDMTGFKFFGDSDMNLDVDMGAMS